MIVTKLLLRLGADICGRANKEDDVACEYIAGTPEDICETPAVGLVVAAGKPSGNRGGERDVDGKWVALKRAEDSPKEPRAAERGCE